MTVLQKAEDRYGKPKIKIDTRQFTSNTMGLPQKKVRPPRKPTEHMLFGETRPAEREKREEDLDYERKKEMEVSELP